MVIVYLRSITRTPNRFSCCQDRHGKIPTKDLKEKSLPIQFRLIEEKKTLCKQNDTCRAQYNLIENGKHMPPEN